MKYQAPRGVKDLLPPESEAFRRLEDEVRDLFVLSGFREVRLPIFESAALFFRSIGESTDIVEKEMYLFEGKGGEKLALRPEGTASLLRAAIEHRLAVDEKLRSWNGGLPGVSAHRGNQVGVGVRVVGAEDLGPGLVKLPQTPRLRPFVAEHCSLIVEAGCSARFGKTVLDGGPQERGGSLGAKRKLFSPFAFEKVHLLFHDIG